jgi:hypothetical protein
MSGQINDGEKHIFLVKGTTYTDTILSRFAPTTALVDNCSMLYSGLGQQRYKVTINPPSANPNFVGKAKAIVQYTDGLPPKPRYLTYHITYVNSSISTSPDFVTLPGNDEVFVLPLQNDISSGPGLKLNGIAHVQSGSARIHQDSVFFSLEEDANSGFVLYSVSDSEGATANGMIYFMKRDDSPDQLDTLRYTLLNTKNQYIFLPSEGFFPEVLPTKGL